MDIQPIFLEAGALPGDFFTFQSMLTLTGATAAVFIVCNGLQSALNFNPRWLGLAISIIISMVGVYFSNGTPSQYFVGLINGFFIYTSAAGTTHITGKKEQSKSQDETKVVDAQGLYKSGRKFLTPWW